MTIAALNMAEHLRVVYDLYLYEDDRKSKFFIILCLLSVFQNTAQRI